MENNQMIEANALKQQLEAIQKRDMAKLGDGSMFWIDEGGQKKRGFRAKVDLAYPNQFCFPVTGSKKAMITGEGYDKLNQYAGIEIFKPKVLVGQNGSEAGNPFFERSTDGALISVMMRGIGVGYAPTGNLASIDQTIFINLNTLLVQEIQSKMKKFPAIATIGIRGQKPEEISYYETSGYGKSKTIGELKTEKAVGVWYFVSLHGEMGYWVNLSHPEIQEAFGSFTQKQRFLERTTFTILKRLILSSHPAIATKTPIVTSITDGDKWSQPTAAKAYAIVFGYQAEEGDSKQKHKDMEGLAAKLAQGEAISNIETITKLPEEVAEEPEIADATIVADPTEIVVEQPEETYEPEPETEKVPEEKPAETIKEPAIKRLQAIMIDKSLSKIVLEVRDLMKITSFADLRKADEATIEAFIQAVNERKNK